MRSSRKLLSEVGLSLWEVFSTGHYFVLAAFISFGAFAASLWLTNIKLISIVIFSPLFSIPDKLLLMGRLLGGITTNVEPIGAGLIIVMSILFGINASLLLYSFIRKSSVKKASGLKGTATVSAGISALFGAGCASCGTYLLGATASSLGASWLIVLLPFAGKEFLFFSILLLMVSITWLSKSIQVKNVCV